MMNENCFLLSPAPFLKKDCDFRHLKYTGMMGKNLSKQLLLQKQFSDEESIFHAAYECVYKTMQQHHHKHLFQDRDVNNTFIKQ
jgi:hypothetical protein